MKAILKIFIVFTVFATLASCEDDDNGNGSTLSFTGTVPAFEVVLGSTDTDYAQFATDDKVGIFVGASTEKTYVASTSGSTVSFTASGTVLTSIYGDYAHVLAPVNGSGINGYYKAPITVSSTQTVTDGHNPNVLNCFGSAEISDRNADVSLTHYGGAIVLGFCSDDDLTISSVVIQATSPNEDSYLAGELDLVFDTQNPLSDPSIGDVSSGSNKITVTIEGGMTLTSSMQYIPVGVLPFSTAGDGLTLTIYEQSGAPCYYGEIFTDSSAIGNDGEIYINSGELALYEAELYTDEFEFPVITTITVTDYATQSPAIGQEIYIYSVDETEAETLYSTYTSDENGQVILEIPDGEYRVYSSIDGIVPIRSNSAYFTVARNSQDVDLVLYPIVFYDDTEWITADMGGTTTLANWYKTIDPPATSSGTEKRWNQCTTEAQNIITGLGWTMSDYVYLRLSNYKFGKNSTTAYATTPAIPSFTSGDFILSFSIVTFHTVSSSKWVYEECYFNLEITGSGSFSEDDPSVTSYDSDYLPSNLEAPDQEYYYKIVVYGAGPDTQITLSNQQPSTSTTLGYRMILEEFSIAAAEDLD